MSTDKPIEKNGNGDSKRAADPVTIAITTVATIIFGAGGIFSLQGINTKVDKIVEVTTSLQSDMAVLKAAELGARMRQVEDRIAERKVAADVLNKDHEVLRRELERLADRTDKLERTPPR